MRLAIVAQRCIFSVVPGDSLDKAICLMDEHHIRHLPVLDGATPVGMLSDRDLLMAVGWMLENERAVADNVPRIVGPRRVGEIMSSPAVCLGPEIDIHTAARMMAEAKIHAFPLVHHGTLVGLVTSTDLLKAFCHPGHAQSCPPLLKDEVSRHMRINVRTVAPKEPLHVAARLLREAHIRHLPVTAGGKLVGVISDRDIRRACGVEMIADQKAEASGEFYIGLTTVMEVMSKQVHTLVEKSTMLEALQLMTDHHIGCLPVMRDESVVGIITETDMLRIIAQIDEGQQTA